MDTMLTVEEVAAILKVQPLTVRQMLREGRIRGFKIGKAWRTTLTILEEDVACMSRGQKPPRLEQAPPDPAAPQPKKRGRKPGTAKTQPAAEEQPPVTEPAISESVSATSPEASAETEELSAESAKRKKKAADAVDQQLLF